MTAASGVSAVSAGVCGYAKGPGNLVKYLAAKGGNKETPKKKVLNKTAPLQHQEKRKTDQKKKQLGLQLSEQVIEDR